MSYTILKVTLEDGGSSSDRSANLKRFIDEVNTNIQNGYTPLGSPGIDRSGYTVNAYQAFIKTPASASPASPAAPAAAPASPAAPAAPAAAPASASPAAPAKQIKQVDKFTNTTLTVEGKTYKLDPTKDVYERGLYIGNFYLANMKQPWLFENNENPGFSVNINDFEEINSGGSKSTSRKSYKKYTKKSSSRRHKNRK